MTRLVKNSRPIPRAQDACAVFDDGGTGLFEAAQRRFLPRACVVFCDDKHTVWVKSPDGHLSLGLPQWRVGRRSIDDLLDVVEQRLAR